MHISTLFASICQYIAHECPFFHLHRSSTGRFDITLQHYSKRVTYRFDEYEPGAGEAVRSYDGGGKAEVGEIAAS